MERVTITDKPCCDNANWKQYAVHAPDVSLYKITDFNIHAKELKADPPVQEMPVQSLITSPSAGDVICNRNGNDDTVLVKGIAWGGGGCGINRVDVSLDGGENFTKADILDKEMEQRRNCNWSWVFFEKEIPIPVEMKANLKAGEGVKMNMTSRAANSFWNVQPECPYKNRNPHGCCVNHWYKVPCVMCPKATCNIKAADGDFGNKPSGGVFKKPFRNLDQKCNKNGSCKSSEN